MDISNKTLGLLLVAAIVFSIGGTIVSLNKLDGFSTTGFATTNITNGTVTLSVAEALSIVLDDAAIDFGTCSLPGGQDIVVDSDLTRTSSSVNNSLCDGTTNWDSTNGDFITVHNNGNVDANVTIKSNINGTHFYGDDANSWIAYKGEGSGCAAGNLTDSYTGHNITTVNTEMPFCSFLKADQTENSINLTIRSYIASTATSGNVMTLTFTAHNVA